MATARTTNNNFSPLADGVGGASLDAGAGVSLFSAFDQAAETEAPGETNGFDVYTLDDLETYTTPPDHIIAGNGIIRRRAGTLFTGGTGLGKSVACADIAVWLAGGMPLFGVIPVASPCKVHYIQAENDADVLKRDILAAVKHSKADRATVQANLRIHHTWGLFGDGFHEKMARDVSGDTPDVYIVDPYQTFVNPGDLNGTTSFLEWIAPVQRLMHEFNFALLLVAHTPKPQVKQDWNVRQMVYSAAGTSAISNWARCSMELTTAQHEIDRFRLTFGKNAERNGLTDDHGRPVREIYLQHSGTLAEPYWTVADDQSEPSRSKYADAIIQAAFDSPSMSYGEIAKVVGCSKSLVARYYPKDEK